MSTTAPRSSARVVHQDYAVRVRFSNSLQPPPVLPKLLEIPSTGLASGQYTTPGFASRLAREQPLNIEADGELGMPLNLVGMPGVFDGDERSIQAPAQPPPVKAHDRPLLRPLAALGKHKVAEANVSFLRRTEYISSSTVKRPEGSHARVLLARKPARRPPLSAADSPRAIKRSIDVAFEVAQKELSDTKRVKHPTKKHLKLVDAAPLIPDLDAFPDSGAYVTIKFLTNPVSSSGEYDSRLLSGLLRPLDRNPAEEAMYEAALEAHEQDPTNYPKPPNLMNYEYYLPQTTDVGRNFRRKFDVEDPEHESEDLYTNGSEGSRHFQFNRLRTYETAQETELNHATKYDDEIILAYNDDDAFPRQKAVYYYPIMQRSSIRPQRTKNIARTNGFSQEDEDEQMVDQLDVTVDDPHEDMRDAIKGFRDQPFSYEQQQQQQQEQQEQQEQGDGSESNQPRAERDPDDVFGVEEAGAEPDADADAEGEDAMSAADGQRRGSDAGKSDSRMVEEDEDDDRDAEGEDE